jgi:hypothetical protein
MDPLYPVTSILTAMISPVVVISACGALIASTTTRAARVNDRLHRWVDDFVALMREEPDDPLGMDHRAMVFYQIDRLTSRARLLQVCLMVLYVALAFFVATSFTVGVIAAAATVDYLWAWSGIVTIGLALAGGGGLLIGCTLLISEARLALASTNDEMDFIWQVGKRHATEELLESWRAGQVSFVRLPRAPRLLRRKPKP